MATRKEHAARKGRESLAKKLGFVANQIHTRDGHACTYCHATQISESRAGKSMHLDHLTPRSAGGKDRANNIVVACTRCNDVRHDMDLKTWAAYAKKHLGLSFDPKAIIAHAAKPLPDRAAVHADAAKHHAQQMWAHVEEAKRAKTPEGRQAHQLAAEAHRQASAAAEQGQLRQRHEREARKATKSAHGITRDELGRFS
jgi:type IV secretory pathway VirB10-like protein